MLEIKVYGPGCARCKETERRVRHVLEEAGVEAKVTHEADIMQLAKLGVMSTPAVAIDGVIKSAGTVPEEEQIKTWLETVVTKLDAISSGT